jgi:uncharacterized protein (DUF342 family)
VSDAASVQRTLVELREQLEQSRQQQERLKEALTRVLSLIDDVERP